MPLDDVFQNLTFDECYLRLVESNYRPPIPEIIPEEFQLMLQLAWHTDPLRRPTCRELTTVAERTLYSLQNHHPIIAQVGSISRRDTQQSHPEISQHSVTEV